VGVPGRRALAEQVDVDRVLRRADVIAVDLCPLRASCNLW